MSLLNKYISLLIVFALFSSTVIAQQKVNDKTARAINLGILKLVESYENGFSLNSNRDYDNFYAMFVNDDVMVFNDIMPDNNLDSKIKVSDYLPLLDEYYRQSLNVELIPYEIGPIKEFTGKKGVVSVFADKIISGITKKNINYTDTFNIEIVVAFKYLKDNIDSSSFKISAINALKKYGKYCILSAKRKTLFGTQKLSNDTLIINNSTLVTLDSEGKYLLKRIYKNSRINITSNNEDLIGTYKISQDFINAPSKMSSEHNGNIDKNTKDIYFTYPQFYIEPVISINPFSNSPILYLGDAYKIAQKNNSSFSAGLNMGALVSMKHNIYIKTGIHYKKWSYTNTLNNYSYSYKDTDPDGSGYLRTNNINDIKEIPELEYLVVPLGIQKAFHLYKKFYINIELGGALNYNLSAAYSSSANAKYSGHYGEDLYNITIQENGVYDFGDFDLSNNSELNTKKEFLSVYSNVGVAMRINKRTFLNIGMQYDYGINSIFIESKKKLSRNYSELNSLTDVSGAYYLRELNINLSLFYKF